MPRVRIWKQDPTTSIGVRTAYIHTPIEPGPKDNLVEIAGIPTTAMPDANGDFLSTPDNGTYFDAVHTFAVVRQVITMYERALTRSGIGQQFRWHWSGPIDVYPHAGEDRNAFYSRGERSLKFFYFKDPSSPATIYTCRSFDIVSHEAGHAFLDSVRPGYWDSEHAETWGLHESFGDLTAIFMMLAQMDQCEAIIAESGADLHAKSFFPAVAEEFGQAIYGHDIGLRDADNDLTMSDVSDEPHELSMVFTGAVYDILADMFDQFHDYSLYDPAESLFRLGKHMSSLVLLSIMHGPERNATYRQIAEKMIEVEPRMEWKPIILRQFVKRGVL